MKPQIFLASLVTLSLLSVPAFAQSSGTKNTKTRVEAKSAFDANAEAAIVELVNAERAKVGLGPLAVDARLRAAARTHSKDMGDLNFFDHTSPVKGRESFTDRIKAQGLTKFGAAGENIAAGPFNSASRARGFMKLWMESPGHRANILDPNFQFIGVGVYVTPSGEVFATQNFSKLGIPEATPSPDIALEEEIDLGGDFEMEPEFFGVEEDLPMNPEVAPEPVPQEVAPSAKAPKSRRGAPPQSYQPEDFKPAKPSKKRYEDPEVARIKALLEELSDSEEEEADVTIIVLPSEGVYYRYYSSQGSGRYIQPNYYQVSPSYGSCH